MSSMGRSVSGASSNTSFASSNASTAVLYDLPQRVAVSEDSDSISTIRRLRAAHLEPYLDKYSNDFTKDFQDFEYNWVSELEVENVAEILDFIRTEYNLPIKQHTPVSHLGSGCYNKVFAFHADPDAVANSPTGPFGSSLLTNILVLRIGWPLAPNAKLSSEVATMTFVRKEVGIPVPRVYYYEPTAQNPWNVEWSIHQYARGVEYREATYLWDNPECDTVKNLSMDTAHFCGLLSNRHNFNQIGSLYFADHEQNTTGTMGLQGYVIGPSTQQEFWFGPRAYYADLPRGPFNSITEYLSAHVEVHVRDCNNPDIFDAAFNYNTNCSCPTKYRNPHTCPHVKNKRAKFLKLAQEVQSKLIPAVAAKAELAAQADGYSGPLGGCGAVLWHHDMHPGNLFVQRRATKPPTHEHPFMCALDFEQVIAGPRWLFHPVPKVAYGFEFDKQGCDFPVGDSPEPLGPSLEELFAGNAKRMKACPKVFNPPPECQAPWAVALLNVLTRMKRMSQMLEDDLEWWIEAFEFLGFPQGDEDYGLSEVDDDSDSSGGDHAGSADGNSDGGAKRQGKGPDDGGGKRQSPAGSPHDPLNDIPAFLRRYEYQVGLNLQPSVPIEPEAFLKLPPFVPRRSVPSLPPNSASAEVDIPKKVNKGAKLSPLVIGVSRSESLDDVPLTPSPNSVRSVHVRFEPQHMTVQVPLQDLIRSMDGHLAVDRPHDAVPGSPWTQVTQAPPVAPSSWLPAFLSTFLCCY